MAIVKCRIHSCGNLVGPIRQKVSDLCYTCDRNLEDWSGREAARRMEWNRRCRMFVERQEALPRKSVTNDEVAKYVRTIVTRNMRKKAKK